MMEMMLAEVVFRMSSVQRVGCCTTATTNAPCRLENAMHERERFARCSGELE